MKHEIHTGHRVQQALWSAHIADVELELGMVVGQPHVVLFLLIAGEDADLADVGIEEAVQDGIAEGAGAAGNEKGCAGKYCS